jgi:penicillin-binding protein 1C
VDPIAVLRAVYYNIQHKRVVSGASTLTQQTVKMVMPRGRRGLREKSMEAVWALRLERALSKDEILEQYLNRAPYGHQRFGIEAAAHLYFGKSSARLSLAEATFIAGLPQAPTAYDPYRRMERAKRRQGLLLRQMRDRGAITPGDYKRALAEEIVLAPRQGVLHAPHFTDHVLRTQNRRLAEVRTTLDLDLQTTVENIVRTQLAKMEGLRVSQAAVVVLDNAHSDVLAWVGSAGYFDPDKLGANDGVLARRQPGSTLKPFVYELYFEKGGTPADMIADLPTEFPTKDGVYIPRNFSRTFQGPVSVRHALGNSLNVPVIAVAAEVGPKAIQDRLAALGIDTLDDTPEHYGLGIALGDGDVRLLDLAGAYATLARGGVYLPVGYTPGRRAEPVRVMPEDRVYQVLDILTDDSARALSFGRDSVLRFPYRVAVKTGTSTHFRDAWTVGVTPDYTVAVWTGNFDGKPMRRVTGSRSAAPILRHVFQALYPDAAGPSDVRWFRAPRGVVRHEVCALSGQPAGPHCPQRREEVFTQGRKGASAAPADGADRPAGPHVCQVHQAVPIDTRNGLRATVGCDPAVVETRLFVSVPPEWDQWAAEHELQPPPQTYSPLCGDAPPPLLDRAVPHIANPIEGDEFLVSGALHVNAQSLALKAFYTGDEELTWYVDGAPIAVVARPFVARWQMTKGEHRIGVGRKGVESEVRVIVR